MLIPICALHVGYVISIHVVGKQTTSFQNLYMNHISLKIESSSKLTLLVGNMQFCRIMKGQ